MVKPITTLDQIIGNNVYNNNEISDNSEHFSLISCLFGYYLNPHCSVLKVIGNTYILNSFQCFVDNKQRILLKYSDLDRNCKNKGLLGLLLSKLVKDIKVKDKQQNLIKKDTFKIFKNVDYLHIRCVEYSFCLLSFLSVIDGTKINKVDIYGKKWLPSIVSSSSFESICTQYDKANFKIEMKYGNERCIINKNIL